MVTQQNLEGTTLYLLCFEFQADIAHWSSKGIRSALSYNLWFRSVSWIWCCFGLSAVSLSGSGLPSVFKEAVLMPRGKKGYYYNLVKHPISNLSIVHEGSIPYLLGTVNLNGGGEGLFWCYSTWMLPQVRILRARTYQAFPMSSSTQPSALEAQRWEHPTAVTDIISLPPPHCIFCSCLTFLTHSWL